MNTRLQRNLRILTGGQADRRGDARRRLTREQALRRVRRVARIDVRDEADVGVRIRDQSRVRQGIDADRERERGRSRWSRWRRRGNERSEIDRGDWSGIN